MSQPSYMKMYAQNIYAETMNLSLEESGALYRLRACMWVNGGKIKDDDSKIARVLGIHTNKWKSIRGNLQKTSPSNLVELEGGYLTITGLVTEYETALGKRNKLSANGGTDTRGVLESKPLENNETQKANAPPDALAIAKQMDNQKLKQLQNPLSLSLSLSLTDKDNDTDTRENNVGSFSQRSKSNQNTGPMALAAFLPQITQDNSINSRLEAVFNSHNLPFPLDLHLVHSWIEGGAEFNRDIMPAIKGVCERISRRLLKPPTSFAYFQEAVATAALKNSPE